VPQNQADSFNVVLDGTILAGFDRLVVQAQLAGLIKRDVEFAGQLLSGRRTTIKSGVDAALGERYITALRHVGVSASLQPESLEIDPDLELGPAPSTASPAMPEPPQAGISATPKPTAAPQAAKMAAPIQAAPSNTGPALDDLYRAAIGPKNQAYYLAYFRRADAAGRTLPSWNWPALLLGGPWVLYRKMYFLFVVYFVTLSVSNGMDRKGFFWSSLALFLPLWIAFAVYANALYHASIKKKISSARKSSSEPVGVLDTLRAMGGVHKSVPWIFGAITATGILAAIALPAYQGYTNRANVSGTLSPADETDIWQVVLGLSVLLLIAAIIWLKAFRPKLSTIEAEHVISSRKACMRSGKRWVIAITTILCLLGLPAFSEVFPLYVGIPLLLVVALFYWAVGYGICRLICNARNRG